jgi:hypothetical protein
MNAKEGKKLHLIGVAEDEVEKKNEGAYTLNHEEFHFERTLDGHAEADKNELDHLAYYGEYRWDSPNDNDVKRKEMYARTLARQAMKEIDEQLKKKEDREKDQKNKEDGEKKQKN